MSMQTHPSALDSEANVAAHVQREREARGWSTAELARRVTEAGCPMNQSAVWRIESGEPRRKITVDEMLGFAKVFGMNVAQLLAPGGGSEVETFMSETVELAEAFAATKIAENNYNAWLYIVVMHAWADESLRTRMKGFIEESMGPLERYPKRRTLAVERIGEDVARQLERADKYGIPPSADDMPYSQRWIRDRLGEARTRRLLDQVREAAMSRGGSLEGSVKQTSVLTGTDFGKEIGKNIKSGRRRAGIMPSTLASTADITSGQLISLENGFFDNLGDSHQVRSVVSSLYDATGEDVSYYMSYYDEAVQALESADEQLES